MNVHDTFFAVLTQAVNDFIEHGFDTQKRFEFWMTKIREAATRSLTPEAKLNADLRAGFQTIFRRLVDRGGILKMHEGIERFTVQKLAPALRAELDRAIRANASLIKLNQTQSVEKTLQRFAGWATSVPAGGTRAEDKVKTKTQIRKALAQLPFEERRVAIDQGAKFSASLNRIVAENGGAIALRWRSHWRQQGYNYREDHKERDGKIYLLRNSWAVDKGLVKPGPAGYYDEVTAVAQEPFCRCFAVFLYSPSQLPPDMLTDKGRAELAKGTPA